MKTTPTHTPSQTHRSSTRRLAALALLFACVLASAASAAAPESVTLPFNQGWLFGGKATPAALNASFDDTTFEKITLPHIVTKLSWQKWDYHLWQDEWVYRKHFKLPENMRGMRVFIDFEGVLTGVTPVINGHKLEKHLGGFLPVRYELTKYLADGGADNVLAVEVDGRWSNVPPQGSPKGTQQVDYLLPAGIHRQATLVAVPQTYIKDIYAKPVNVLDAATRRVEVSCTLDAAADARARRGKITAELRDGTRTIARAEQQIPAKQQAGKTECKLTLANLGDIALWSPDTPKLYEVVTTLAIDGQPAHTVKTRIGFREAKFTNDGFFLNGKRLQIFGLNRHELFPYVGFAMPPRAMRHDAEILKNVLNVNFVRCSHYPQSDAFLDACDELGLLVWQEIPGWQYVGDAAWQDLLVRDVHDMVIRDRNRPSVVIWGTRVNESNNNLALYRRTRAAAKALDDTRPLSGSMHPPSRKNWETDWEEDVFAYDDYHANKDGSVGILPPVKGHPYMLAEAVGQFNYKNRKNFDSIYRRAGDVTLQMRQALYHAQAHDTAAANPRNSGVVAWCALEYGSLVNGYNALKCPGVVDTFRIPKLGATFYMAQVDSSVRPVIAPNFYWDFGAATPRGPGKGAMIFSNCERLEVFVDDKPLATLKPDVKNFPHLKHAPFLVDLDMDGASKPELRIDGYVGGKLVLSRKFSGDPSKDKLYFAADDAKLTGDGSDATRLELRITDAYGANRAFATGDIDFEVTGPGELVGDNPLSLAAAGGAGAVWLKTKPGGSGAITVTAKNRHFGSQSVTVNVKKQERQ